ncbi:hypothetical protein CDD81_8102 [Ophiocordyceps australis]|uniref:Carrier domain-containing protein n=1 Tax=Ophiocordyceps australis TaxID=1399860 RepID=A0A2C5XGD6_9HYPO|nr:hypothetical protein CDD81_8102 [Ophiocordyceps australis]
METATREMVMELEKNMLQDAAIKQARIVNLAARGNGEPEWTAALVLAKPRDSEQEAATVIKHARKQLRKLFDKSLVPKRWIVLDHFPTTDLGLVDEQRLAQSLLMGTSAAAHGLTTKERRRALIDGTNKSDSVEVNEPEMVTVLQALWAQVLLVDASQIKHDDNFLRRGGDSILAIQLSTAALEYGINLPTRAILQNPELVRMAAAAQISDEDAHDALQEPFETLAISKRDEILVEIEGQCALESGAKVVDAYPCSPLQEGLMALALKQPGSYISRFVWRLDNGANVRLFRQAWQKTVELCAILRTRIVRASSSHYQAVIEGSQSWEEHGEHGIRAFMENFENIEMGYGSCLCRYALVTEGSKTYFAIIVHHAVFDGLSMRLILDTLHQAYQGLVPSTPKPYVGFINYVQSVESDEAAASYWAGQLQGARQALFPNRGSRSGRFASHDGSSLVKRSFAFPKKEATSITKATVLRAAWALLLAQYCDTQDVCFGTTVSGRHAPVAGLQTMAGPVIATVPVRIKIDADQTVSEFLVSVQSQANEMTAFEQFGLQRIAKVCSDAKEACEFNSLFVIQPAQHLESTATSSRLLLQDGLERHLSQQSMEKYFNYPFVVQPWVTDDSVELEMTYDRQVLTEFQLEAFARQFETVARFLLQHDEARLCDVGVAGPWDKAQAQAWNELDEPQLVNACVHELVEQEARRNPEALAVQAWDGELTYRQLNEAANRLAHHILSIVDIQNDELIHVCFEKSLWHFVSILAINKVGAAWVPLDPSHPLHRQQQVIAQTKARLALGSPSNASICEGLVPNIIEVSAQLDQELKEGLPLSLTASGPAITVSPRPRHGTSRSVL